MPSTTTSRAIRHFGGHTDRTSAILTILGIIMLVILVILA